jgi:hypothetical protein
VREGRRVGGKTATVWGASDLCPGMGDKASANAGRGAGRAETEIKKDAQGPDGRASEQGEYHSKTHQASA